MVKRTGASAVGCLVYLVIIAAIVWFATPFVNAYLDYYRYTDAIEQEAKFAEHHNDTEIQFRLKIFADSLGLPPGASAVQVNRRKDGATIMGTYLQTVNVPLVGPRKLRFNPRAEEKF